MVSFRHGGMGFHSGSPSLAGLRARLLRFRESALGAAFFLNNFALGGVYSMKDETVRGKMETVLDAALVERCKAKDIAAFRELVERYNRHAYGFAFSYLKNPDDALAVSQDAFVRVWECIGTFREGNVFRSWLFGIVRHLSLSRLRKKRRLREISLEDAMEKSGFDISDSGPGPQEALENRETRELVWKAIMELKDEFREVVVLKYFQDMSYREIANSLGIPEGAVMSRLYYARLSLKKKLGPALFRR